MSAIYDGGPAFPQTVAFSPNGEAVTAGMYFAEGPGMTLRDWFAGMALQGIIGSIFCTPEVTFKECAGRAYGMADAMITARERKEAE